MNIETNIKSGLIIGSMLFAMAVNGGKYFIPNTKLYVDATNLGIKPGDTISILAGRRKALKMANFHGDSIHRLIFINSGGAVEVEDPDSYGISMNNCSFFRLTGTGDSTIKYGIKVIKTRSGASGLAIDAMSTDYEIDHVEACNTGFAGITAKTDPTCDRTRNRGNFVQKNTVIHDNYVHNTTGEGLYIGHSFYSGYPTTCNSLPDTLLPSELKGLRVFNNIADSCGWDGIQVGCATSDCEIYDNLITNYGTLKTTSQNSGIQIGGGTTGLCYNNTIINGSGIGIAMFGIGNNSIYNNLIINAGYNYYPEDATKRVYGIFCDDRTTTSDFYFYFMNNTIVSPKTDGIRIYNHLCKNIKVYNNLMLKPGSYGSYKDLTQSYVNYISIVGIDISNNYYSQVLPTETDLNKVESIYNYTSTLPVIDNGKDVSLWGITSDFRKTARPINNLYDIGAFEFSGNAVTNVTSVFSKMITGVLPEFVTIYNMNGTQVLKKTAPTPTDILNLKKELKVGIYLINTTTKGEKYTQKLVVF